MTINFNTDKLNILLSDFYKLTKLTISVWDKDLNQLSFQPSDMPVFCRMIKETKSGSSRCLESDKKICMACKITGEAQTHVCHAGLIDTAIPIKFNDNILGYIMFGQASPEENKKELLRRIKKLSQELDISEKELLESHGALTKYEPDIVQSAANILKLATRYLWLSDMIKISSEGLMEKIDEYVRKNISEKITIEEICREFGISKNKLYSLFKESRNMTVGEYISSQRIERAKFLLSTSDMPISEICGAVGIVEYNYFSRLFKKQTGYTPLSYRKHLPS
ncbi:MAG: helix-turn-helix domain-containing protein [Ruminococcaceae bacterium]|nr:helix-turn-helix domain-containing protein [Oscillospiraceae bacterium]